jgi:2,3-bisphosphoglycerate-independent phosphoglycerate mutase
MKNYPNTLLNASGEAVGLPKGFQGNSEVGHLTIGSGRIIQQSLTRINKSIEDKSFFTNPEFLEAIKNAKKNKTSLHLIGLFQTEGVHAHLNHLQALLKLCEQEKFFDVKIHAITDGRDSPTTKSLNHIKKILAVLKKQKFGEIVTISGRYYAMDRNKNWDRTKQAYDCIMKGETKTTYTNPLNSIKESHKKKITDEFIIPRKQKKYGGVKENDSIIFFNYRTDRTRQLTQSIVERKFEEWKREKKKTYFVAMTQYYNPMNAKVAYPDVLEKNLLGYTIAENGLRQLRISETEKYAHVTFFFNGQNEVANRNEERILIPSPTTPTYDNTPEMSAKEITQKLVEQIKTKKYDFIVVNLVNCDMVGHTGNKKAITKAIETVDACVGEITKTALKENYTTLVFADHGNAEDQTKKWGTSHTTNPVPLILVTNEEKLKKTILEKNKGLQDIAPTVLEILKIKKPKEMTGTSIIKK